MKISSLLLAASVTLAGCHGPAEKAGKDQDKAEAAASGQAYSGDGPNQRLGRARDKVEAAAEDAREADAKALKQQGARIKTQADVAADRLEDQAKAIRKGADRQADAIDAQAKEVAR